MSIPQRLAELQSTVSDKKATEALLKRAIENKRKTIEEKEKLVEIIDMLIINRINLMQELIFSEKVTPGAAAQEKRKEERKKRVSDLIKFFEGHK